MSAAAAETLSHLLLITTTPPEVPQWSPPYLTLLVGFVFAFFLSFGIGSNDVANNFGTSVGSKVITLRTACLIATVFEMAGAITIGNSHTLSVHFSMDAAAAGADAAAAPFVSLPLVILSFLVSFVLAFGIGANDVANSFGTSVGAKVLSLKEACVIASIFEVAGAVLLGYNISYKVSDTIRKGIIDVSVYRDDPHEYMLGNLAALGGSALWLLLATFLKMPISGTHSIVGAVLGFSLVSKGLQGINFYTLGMIVLSWFVSPLLSGLVSSSLFIGIRRCILTRRDPIRPGLRSLPLFYGITVGINVLSILLDGPDVFKIDLGPGWPWWSGRVVGVAVSSLVGAVTAIAVYFFVVPWMRNRINRELRGGGEAHTTSTSTTGTKFTIGGGKDAMMSMTPDGSRSDSPDREEKLKMESLSLPMEGLSPCSSAVPLIRTATPPNNNPSNNNAAAAAALANGSLRAAATDLLEDEDWKCCNDADDNDEKSDGGSEKDRPGVGRLFSFLQILTAAFGSFAHGGNDVSNAIGPLIALWLVYTAGSVESKAATPIWLLVYGGVGISLGLWVWGRRVIKTMGEDLTRITPSSGFTIEIGAALTVLCASKIGLPISTTHCKVGSVVSVGYVRSRNSVDWRLFRNIIFAWLVTVPVSGGLSAIFMVILKSLWT